MTRLQFAMAAMLGGCATAAALPSSSTLCVPPGMAPFASWRPGPAEVVAVADDEGRVVPAVRRMYRIGAEPVAVALWVEGRMVLVDPNPNDAAAPAWVDRGAIAPGRGIALRRDRHDAAPCQWRRAGGAET